MLMCAFRKRRTSVSGLCLVFKFRPFPKEIARLSKKACLKLPRVIKTIFTKMMLIFHKAVTTLILMSFSNFSYIAIPDTYHNRCKLSKNRKIVTASTRCLVFKAWKHALKLDAQNLIK